MKTNPAIGIYYGHTKVTARRLYKKVEKRLSIEQVTQLTEQLNEMCETVSSLLIRKNKIIEQMELLHMSVDHLKYIEKYRVVEIDSTTPKLAALTRAEETNRKTASKQDIDDNINKYVNISQLEVEEQMSEFLQTKVTETNEPSQQDKCDKAVNIVKAEVCEETAQFMDIANIHTTGRVKEKKNKRKCR